MRFLAFLRNYPASFIHRNLLTMQDGDVISMWAEACNKYYKGQYSKCQEILKDALVTGQSDPLKQLLIPLLNNNRIVCQSSTSEGDAKRDSFDYEEVHKSLKGTGNDLSNKLALAIVAYNCALSRLTINADSALQILEESLLSCRNIFVTINVTQERSAKKRKVDGPPQMIHVNPSSPSEYILELLSFIPESLFHDSSRSDMAHCGTKCTFLEIIIKTIQLYSLLKMKHESQREKSLQYLSSIEQIMETKGQTTTCKLHTTMSPVTYYLLAIGNYLDGNNENTFLYLDKCLKAKHDFYPSVFLKGQLEFDNGNFEKARRLFLVCSRDQNYRVTDSLNMEGACFLKLENSEAAMRKFQQAISLENSKIEPIFNSSVAFQLNKKSNHEIEMLNFVKKGAQMEVDDQTETEKIFLEDKKNIIGKGKTMTSSEITPLTMSYLLANATARSISPPQKIVGEYEDIISKSEKEEIGVVSKCKVLCELAYVYLQQKDFKKAYKQCDKILKIYPNNPQALLYVADILNLSKKLEKAIDTIDKAIAAIKNQRNEKSDISEVSFSIYSHKDSQKLLVEAYNNKAIILIRQAKLDEATISLKNALKIDPKNTQTIYHMTLLLLQKGKTTEACLLWMDHRLIPTSLSPNLYSSFLSERNEDNESYQKLDKAVVLKYWVTEQKKESQLSTRFTE